jgi:hypothetical protein
MPVNILGYRISNSVSDIKSRQASIHGYLEKDIPVLVELGFLRKKPKKGKNAKDPKDAKDWYCVRP